MISVQNLPQLLNGNRLYLLPIFFIFGFYLKIDAKELSASNTLASTNTISAKDSFLQKPEIFDLQKPEIILPTVTATAKKEVYNIAVILPLILDQIPLGMYEDDSTKQLTAESKNALAFYTGCQMAKEAFSSSQLNANIYFIDDESDSLSLTQIFQQKPFPNVDYIVGPLGFKNLKNLADEAKKRKIPLISPDANSMFIKDNPYYFNATPSLKQQYSFILENAKAKFPDKQIEVIYDGMDSTAESIRILKDISTKSYAYNPISYSSLRSSDNISKALEKEDSTSNRVILIYSSKENYIKAVIGKLKGIKNPLTIYTSSTLKNTKAVSELKSPHTILTVSPYNSGNLNNIAFLNKFDEKAKRKPEDMVAMGHDLLLHLFNILEKGQALADNTYSYSSDFNNAQVRFEFKPVLNKSGNIDYYDNSILYLYKLNNGSFTVITP